MEKNLATTKPCFSEPIWPVKISYYPLPSGLFRDNLQHWLEDFARLHKVQFTSTEGMSDDTPIHECESEIDHYTGHYVPYFFPRMCGFFNVPQIFYYVCKGLKDGAYSLSTLSEKTRKSNCLQMLLRRQHFLLSYLKTLRVGPGRGLNPQPPTQQTGAYPIELTGRRLLL